jgi:hypothetical protein
MYQEFETLSYVVADKQNQRRREAEAYRLAQANKPDQTPRYGAALAAVGAWMAENGERLQARYGQQAQLATDPSCADATAAC